MGSLWLKSKDLKCVCTILQDPQILDITADQTKIKQILADLQIILDELQKRAFQYKTYQKNFKVRLMLLVFHAYL